MMKMRRVPQQGVICAASEFPAEMAISMDVGTIKLVFQMSLKEEWTMIIAGGKTYISLSRRDDV